MDRAAIGTNDLVRLLILLVVVWLILEVLGELLGTLLGPFGALRPIIGVVVLILLVLFLLDRV